MMACLPVISTKVGAILEAVIDGVTGYIVPPNDSLALRGAIASLLAAPESASAKGYAGREHAVKFFSRETMLDRMEVIFQKALEE